MRILIAAIAALVTSITAANAQPITCHLEGTVGVGISTAKIKDTVTGDHLAVASNGLLVAPGAGCDIHFGDTLVGAFGRYDFGKTTTSVAIFGNEISAEFKDIWLVAARAGFRVNPATTLYGFAGYSGVKLDLGNGSADLTKTLNGLSAGGGIEWMTGGPWAMKLEYTYTNLNTEALGTDIKIEPVRHDVRLGMTYRFLAPNGN